MDSTVRIRHDSEEHGSDYIRKVLDGSQSHVYLTIKSPQNTRVVTRFNRFGMNNTENPAPVGHRVQTHRHKDGVEWHFEHIVPQSKYKYLSSDKVPLWSVHLSLIG